MWAAAGRRIYVRLCLRVWATWLLDFTCTERECMFVVRVRYLIDIDNFYLLVFEVMCDVCCDALM